MGNWLGSCVDHPVSFSVKVNEKIDLYIYPPLGQRDILWGSIYIYFTQFGLKHFLSH